MKDKNLPTNYDKWSLEELTREADKMIADLEKQKDLENSLENYQNLLRLNSIIEKKFKKNNEIISKKAKEKISNIILKKNAK